MVSSHLGRRMVATPPGGQSGRLGVAPPLGVAGRVIPADPSGRRGGRHQTRDGRSGLSQYVTARGGMVTRTSFAGLSRLVLVLTDYEWNSTLKGILRGNGFQRVPVAKCFLFGCSRAHVYAVLLKSKFWWRLDEHRCTARAAPITERTVQHHAALLHDRFRYAPSDLHPRSPCSTPSRLLQLVFQQ